MKHKIYNNNIRTIELTLESYYEMRALYVLVKFAGHAAFRDIAIMIDKFDDISGLGKYCNRHILKSPIALIFNLLVNRSDRKLSAEDKRFVLAAAKKSIAIYNEKLQLFYATEFFNDPSLLSAALTLFKDSTYGSDTFISEQAFNQSSYIKLRKDKLGYRGLTVTHLYDAYIFYQDIIRGMFPPNKYYSPNHVALYPLYRALSDMIAQDIEFLLPIASPLPARSILYPHIFAHPASKHSIKGVDIHQWEFTITPAFLASSIAIFITLMLTICKKVYDKYAKTPLDNDSTLAYSYTILSGFILLISSYLINLYKRRRDEGIIDAAVAKLELDIPSFKSIMDESNSQSVKSKLENIHSASEIEMTEVLPLLAQQSNANRYESTTNLYNQDSSDLSHQDSGDLYQSPSTGVRFSGSYA